MTLSHHLRRAGYFFLAALLLVMIAGSTANLSIASSAPDAREKVVLVPAEPRRLVIPSVDVDHAVVSVGYTRDGDMDVPGNPQQVGWYEYGARPGNVGNAVFAGHLDTAWETPGVFWDLKDVQIGDDVFVEDADGQRLHFRVIGKKSYRLDEAPKESIFGPAEGRYLNLITCSGSWNDRSGEYDERLVVYTELVTEDEE